MNKLVSGNPVLRFKEGRKILKGEDGLKIKSLYYYLNPDTGHMGIKSDLSSVGDNNIRLTLRYTLNKKLYGSFDGGKLYYDLSSGKPLNYKSNSYLLAAIDRGKQKKPGGTGSSNGVGTRKDWKAEYTNNFLNTLSNDEITHLKLAMGSDNGYLDPSKMLEFLIANLGKGSLGNYGKEGVDGRWGNVSRDAWELYKKKYISTPKQEEIFETPAENNETPITTPTKYTTNNTYMDKTQFRDNIGGLGILSNADLINWMHLTGAEGYDFGGNQWAKQFRSDVDRALGGDYSDANIRKTFNTAGNWGRGFLGGGDLSDFQNAMATNARVWNGIADAGKLPTIQFDRSATREWLRDNGFNPYSLTGALRKALRMILNGLGTDEDKKLIGLTNGLSEILTNYKYLKQGGTMNILPSRNIVERFKLGRKITFAKPGDKMLYNGKEVVTEETLDGQTIYRRKNGTYVYENNKNLSPLKSTPKTAPKPKVAPKVDLGSTEVNRFAIASRKGTRYFDSAEKAKAYLKNLPSGSAVFRDMGEEWKGSVVKADRTKGKDAVATSYGRKQAEKYNNLSYKDAYKAAQSSGNKYFAYKGKVYKTDLKDGKDNMTEMQGLYGTHLGWSKDPKLQNTLSRAARELYRKDTKASNTNRNANYNGKTNKQVSAEADKKVALTWNEKLFMDLMLPTPANMINYGIDIVTGNIPNKPHVSGLNIPGLFTDVIEGNYKDAGYRALDLGLSFAPGARVNMTPGGTNVTKGATLLPNGTRTFSKWQLNSLGKNATRPMEGVLRSPKGTLYYIDNGQFTKDITAPLLISNVPVQRTYDLEK